MPGVGERSSYAPGTFCWAELGTVDPQGATAFYVGLFGWDAVDMALAEGAEATILQLSGCDVCALQRHDARQGPPGWLSYVSVESADETAERAVAAGGEVVREPQNVYAAARTAILADPTGAVFGLWEPRERIGATLVNDPGAMCLNQLNTTDPARATDFYATVFGWRIEQVGSADQLYWGIYNGPGLNGGMMSGPAPSSWLVYFACEDADVAADRLTELGGRVVVPPMSVPGGRIAVGLDPQGAVLGLLSGNLDP